MEAAIPILKPVIALNLWTFAVAIKMMSTRLSSMKKHGIKPKQNQTPGALNSLLPMHDQWPAHNYDHLLMQPAQFYAIALTLAVLSKQDRTNVRLAWAYVGLRIVHSLTQISYNIVELRFVAFVASSSASLALAVRAALQLFSV